MTIEQAHSYLLHPAKHADDQPTIRGTRIPHDGPLFSMLTGVFNRASGECNIDIVFRPDERGRQQNVCRDLLVAYTHSPTTGNGRSVAARLQEVTTHRSGLGLLFLMKGRIGGRHQLVISRFPADQGVIAQEGERELSVEFIERVFMKSSKAYKSAFYSSNSLDRGFWDGRAVDRQIRGPREISDYWIREFLDSELRTTGPAGTKRMAVALRTAIRTTDQIDVKHELVSAATLLRGRHGTSLSANQLLDRLGVSDAAVSAVKAGFIRSDLMEEVFQFDRDEFQRHVPYRAVELDNGALLVADDDSFSDIFETEVVNADNRVNRYSTEGRILNETLRSRK